MKAKIKEMILGLKGVFVKRFEFEKEGEYTLADVESIRSQLSCARLVKRRQRPQQTRRQLRCLDHERRQRDQRARRAGCRSESFHGCEHRRPDRSGEALRNWKASSASRTSDSSRFPE